MKLLRGKSSERGSVVSVSESERQCGVRVMSEWELVRLSVWVKLKVSEDALFLGERLFLVVSVFIKFCRLCL